MRYWRKTALKSDHGDILQSRKEKNASLPIEDTLEHGNGDDPIDDLMTDLASYFEQKMQEDMEAVQREMKDVEIPPELRRKMENTIYRSQTKTSFFRNKRRMRALSAACALFLTVGLGAGVLISPQSGDLRDALYELISDNDGTEAENGLPGRDEEDRFVSGENEADENMNSSAAETENEQISESQSEENGYTSSGEKEDSMYFYVEDGKSDNIHETGGSTGLTATTGSQTDENKFPVHGIDRIPSNTGSGNQDPSSFPSDLKKVYYPSYLPEGYRRTFVTEDDHMDIVFENQREQTMITLQYYTDGFDFYETAAEDGDTVSVNGSQGILYYRNLLNIGSGQKVIYWDEGDVSLCVQCAAGSVSDSEIIQIAESVSLKDTDSASVNP